MTPFFSFLLLMVSIYLSSCMILEPPAVAQPYWGKPTHFILAPQLPPHPDLTEMIFIRTVSWPTNPVPFFSWAICPFTVWTSATLGCLHWYRAVKIDPTVTEEYWRVYGGDPARYVYEFAELEQSAFGWHRLDRVCVWTNMARC